MGVFVFELRDYMFSEALHKNHLYDPLYLSRFYKFDAYIPTSISCLKLQKIKVTLKLSNLFLLSLFVLYLIQCQWIYLPIDKTFSVAKNV